MKEEFILKQRFIYPLFTGTVTEIGEDYLIIRVDTKFLDGLPPEHEATIRLDKFPGMQIKLFDKVDVTLAIWGK